MVVVVAIVVVLALLAGAGSAWVLFRDDGDDRATSSATTSPTSEPAESSTTAPDDEAFAALVEELQGFVEEERGLEFKEDVVVELVDDTEFEERLLVDFDEDREELEETGRIFEALGLVEPGTDLVSTLRDLLAVGVLGFYDPETDELVVRGTETTPYIRQTIVHELVHALDDQWFELDRPELDDVEDESAFAFGALVEGNARLIDTRYRESLSREEQAQLADEEMQFAQEADIDPLTFPVVLYEFLLAPYDLGEVFVESLIDTDGLSLVDETFESPPITSKEIMDADLFLGGFEALDVPAPEADAEVFDEGVFGQFLVQFVLGQELPSNAAAEAADGWMGDWYVAWDEGDSTCLRVDVANDSAESATELAEAWREWAKALPAADVEERENAVVRLTTCSPSAGGAESGA